MFLQKYSIRILSFILPLLLVASGCFAKIPTPPEKPDKAWLQTLQKDARNAGISQATLDTVLPTIILNPKVVKLDRKQPYKTVTFNQYLKNVIPQSRIKKARALYKENKTLLNKIGKHYGVQPRFIVALWGIESNFGENTGGFSIIDSLATLAIDGRRSAFFRKELINALKILDEGHITPRKMLGSWAGAMGQSQFMPSSFLELAVDHDKDGKRDIWTNKADVFASIANYLSKRGWDDKKTWGREVHLPKNFNNSLIGIDNEKSLTQWSELGIKNANGGNLPNRPDVKASLIKPQDDGKKTYLTYSNYKTILNWNRSTYFATAVGLFSDAIQN